MLALTLQSVMVLLYAAFSVLAVMVAKTIPRDGTRHSAGWVVSAVMFSIAAGLLLVQGTWGVLAYFGGSGSAVLERYLRFAPVANHGRTLLMLVFWAALTVLSFKRRFTRTDLVWLACVAAGALAAGGAIGYVEGTLSATTHYQRTALLDTLSFVVLGGVLFILMLRDTIDRYLWSAIATYGFASVFGVIFLSAMAWIDKEGAWAPPAWAIHSVRVALTAGMVAIVFRRLQLARRGVRVQGLLPRVSSASSLSPIGS